MNTKREKVELTKGGKPVKHGLASSYNNHKCGCDECTAAWAEYMKPRIKAYRDAKKKKAHRKGVQIQL